MIFTKIHIDNLYCFSDTEIDFTFDKKLANSTIEYEHLSHAPKFKYKKAVIITGQNASGKTAFGKVLCGIQNFLNKGKIVDLLNVGIHDTDKPAIIDVEFVSSNDPNITAKQLHRLTLVLEKQADKAVPISVDYAGTRIQKTETNTKARQRLDTVFENKKAKRNVDIFIHVNYQKMKTDKNDDTRFSQSIAQNTLETILAEHTMGGWDYSFSEEQPTKNIVNSEIIYAKFLPKFLRVFDQSIKGTEEIFTEKNDKKTLEGIKVIFKNNDVIHITGDGINISPPNRLSRGTLEGIEIAKLFSDMKNNNHLTYYIDEKMAYCHSEFEIAMLNLLIESVPKDGQLFYTTHNYDIVEMNLPPHSHYIFRKKGEFADVIDIGKKFNKNDRSLINYVRNDAFDALPDTSEIDSLAWSS